MLRFSPCRNLCPGQGARMGSAPAPSPPPAAQPSRGLGRSGGGPGRPRIRNPAARGDGSAGGCLSPAAAVPAMCRLGWQPRDRAESRAVPGCCRSCHFQPPNTQTWEHEGCKCIHPPGSRMGTCPFPFRGPCTSPPRRVADPRLRRIWVSPVAFLVLFCLNMATASAACAREPKWHSVHGRRGHGDHVRTQRSLICMCCSPELRLQLPPPSIPLCNYCQRILVKYKLQTIQSLKELSISCCLLS